MRRRGRILVALLLLFVLIASACGDDDEDEGGGTTDTTVAEEEGKKGGSIVVAAEQWPECLNPVTSCTNASWLHWTVLSHVLPRLMELNAENEFVASPLLEGEPELKEEGGKFSVTFKLDPDAVWDDGSPITADDVEFSVNAYAKTTGSLTTTGHELVEKIDKPDKQTVTLHFKEPFADWWDMMGGNQQYVLKKAAFPEAATSFDLKEAMVDSIGFSGGPFTLESWSKEQAVLVRNDKYWEKDRVALLDQVTMVPREDPNTEVNALLTGEAVAIFPQPSVGLTQRLEAPGVKYEVGAGSTYEGLWLNQQKSPVDTVEVREALAHAVDRKAIVDNIVSQIVPGVKVLNCAGWVPTVGKWCDDTDFADIDYDPEKAKGILQKAGWTLGSDGIFTKGGKKLTIEWSTVAGNKRREDTQQLVKEQAKKAGIELTFRNSPAGELFQNRLPKLDFTMGEFANVASPDPNRDTLYLCEQVPSEANGFGGQNYNALCDDKVDELVKKASRTTDVDERIEIIHELGDRVRELVVWIPLYQLPLITAWRDDKLAGPVGEYTNSAYSGFANLYDWSLK